AAVAELARSLRIHPAIIAGPIRYEQRNYKLLSRYVGTGEVRRNFPAMQSVGTRPAPTRCLSRRLLRESRYRKRSTAYLVSTRLGSTLVALACCAKRVCTERASPSRGLFKLPALQGMAA